ncbi:hypothetical protein GCM10027186_53830 [Micromonospora schwarzwaldensis]
MAAVATPRCTGAQQSAYGRPDPHGQIVLPFAIPRFSPAAPTAAEGARSNTRRPAAPGSGRRSGAVVSEDHERKPDPA